MYIVVRSFFSNEKMQGPGCQCTIMWLHSYIANGANTPEPSLCFFSFLLIWFYSIRYVLIFSGCAQIQIRYDSTGLWLVWLRARLRCWAVLWYVCWITGQFAPPSHFSFISSYFSFPLVHVLKITFAWLLIWTTMACVIKQGTMKVEWFEIL